MTTAGGFTKRWKLAERVRAVSDAATYAVVVATLALLLAMTLGIATGGGYVRGKHLLFVIGWIAMAYGTFRLWPSSPTERNDAVDLTPGGSSLGEIQGTRSIHVFVEAVPPNRWIASPSPDRRVSIGGKLFLASILMLATSFVLEVWFGVA